MPNPMQQWFEIHKYPNKKPGTKVVEIVLGLGLAEHRVTVLDENLTPKEQAAGWDHFLSESRRPSGISPHISQRL